LRSVMLPTRSGSNSRGNGAAGAGSVIGGLGTSFGTGQS
jgi:hypothetical protein